MLQVITYSARHLLCLPYFKYKVLHSNAIKSDAGNLQPLKKKTKFKFAGRTICIYGTDLAGGMTPLLQPSPPAMVYLKDGNDLYMMVPAFGKALPSQDREGRQIFGKVSKEGSYSVIIE